MQQKNIIIAIAICIASFTNLFAQQKVLYKQVDTTKLYMTIYQPTKMIANKKYPAIVFFFGGGWMGGDISQFETQAKYFAKRGMVCFLADYRVKSRQKTNPFEAVKDAKSAMRFVRGNAAQFQVDTARIVASGGSAGGHLAACTALISQYNECSDNLAISPIPNALVLFNPVIDNGPGGYGFERIGDAYKEFSPLHNIKKLAPPTIFFLGTKDIHIPVVTAEYYKMVMEKVGSRCDLHIFEGEGHGFFNLAKGFKNYEQTIKLSDSFLQSLGYLSAEPVVEIENEIKK